MVLGPRPRGVCADRAETLAEQVDVGSVRRGADPAIECTHDGDRTVARGGRRPNVGLPRRDVGVLHRQECDVVVEMTAEAFDRAGVDPPRPGRDDHHDRVGARLLRPLIDERPRSGVDIGRRVEHGVAQRGISRNIGGGGARLGCGAGDERGQQSADRPHPTG
ncbi:hypothetical protein [Gordonia sp. PDNC005]|uniref:hypothetical protein n=1 Tax=Gordonia sp. PDNC005 TaxID=2811424 RepID=UPI001F06D327|nr:hypothetical protein [Gordonia sp. PDNC005]